MSLLLPVLHRIVAEYAALESMRWASVGIDRFSLDLNRNICRSDVKGDWASGWNTFSGPVHGELVYSTAVDKQRLTAVQMSPTGEAIACSEKTLGLCSRSWHMAFDVNGRRPKAVELFVGSRGYGTHLDVIFRSAAARNKAAVSQTNPLKGVLWTMEVREWPLIVSFEIDRVGITFGSIDGEKCCFPVPFDQRILWATRVRNARLRAFFSGFAGVRLLSFDPGESFGRLQMQSTAADAAVAAQVEADLQD